MRLLLPPAITIVSVASWFAGLGLSARWFHGSTSRLDLAVSVCVAAAIHVGWLALVVRRGVGPGALVVWGVATGTCSAGLAAAGTGHHQSAALLLEGIPLLFAQSMAPVRSWAERLARWRRARLDILVQLEMSQGILPWLVTVARRVVMGGPVRPTGGACSRFLAQLTDAETLMQARLVTAAVPEDLRQTLSSSASELRAYAEVELARVATDVERRALEAAALCRDRAEQLQHVSPIERGRIAGECESLMLLAAGRGGGAASGLLRQERSV